MVNIANQIYSNRLLDHDSGLHSHVTTPSSASDQAKVIVEASNTRIRTEFPGVLRPRVTERLSTDPLLAEELVQMAQDALEQVMRDLSLERKTSKPPEEAVRGRQCETLEPEGTETTQRESPHLEVSQDAFGAVTFSNGNIEDIFELIEEAPAGPGHEFDFLQTTFNVEPADT